MAAFTKETAAAASAKSVGVPKKRTDFVTQHIIAELTELDPIANVQRVRLLARHLVNIATADKPDMTAVKEVIDRIEGKAKQEIDVSSTVTVTSESASVPELTEILRRAAARTSETASKSPLPN